MKTLISITSYNPSKANTLTSILETYSTYKNVSVVLCTNYPYTIKDLPIEIFIISSSYTGQNHAWSCHQYLKDHYHEYALVANTDDDVVLSEENIDYYHRYKHIEEPFIPGFLIAEYGDSGNKYILSMPKVFITHTEMPVVNGKSCMVPSNLHSAAFVCDKERYRKYLEKGYGITPKEFYPHNIQAAARTELYKMYKKVIPVEELNNSGIIKHMGKQWSREGKFEVPRFHTPETIVNSPQIPTTFHKS